MADATNIPKKDGQSIPAALAPPKKPGGKIAKPIALVAKAAKPTPPAVAKPIKPVEPKVAVAHAPAPVVAAKPAPAPAPVAKPTPVPDSVVAAPKIEPVAQAAASEPKPLPAPEPVQAPEPEPAAEVIEPAPVSTPPAAVPAEPQKESIMATTIENVTNTTAKAQAFFTDASERAKGAVAKSSKLFEEAGAFGKGNVEALVESSKIAAKGFETLGQDAAEFSRKQFEEATTALKTLATVKSPTEFLKLQSDFVRASFDALVAETSRSTETVLKLAGEVAQPISNRIAVAAEKMKTAA